MGLRSRRMWKGVFMKRIQSKEADRTSGRP